MTSEADIWFDSLRKEQSVIACELRNLIQSADPGIVEELKWKQPCYSINRMFCYLQKAKTHVAIGFQRGSSLRDPDGVLEGTGPQMRHLRIPTDGRINHLLVQSLIENAIALDQVNG